jgi:hypothetical protein
MITPPLSTPSFYSAIFEQPAAKFVIGLVAASFAKNDDIDQVLVTSKDFTSDIEATVELQNGTKEVASHLVDVDEEIDVASKFNPIFLPPTEDLYEKVEIDHEGDVIEIDGFTNPFAIMTMKISIEECPNVIEAKVNYKQFPMPPIHEALAGKEVLLS